VQSGNGLPSFKIVGMWLVLALLVYCVSSTTRPIVGILTQPTDHPLSKFGKSYIAASYIKFIEMAGARAVPIFHTASDEELENTFNSINGILFPGGDSRLAGQLFHAGQLLFNLTIQANDKGDYFPLQAHCLGFEMLQLIVSKNNSVLGKYESENISLPLMFAAQFKNSRLFGSLSDRLAKIFSTEPVTVNNHLYGVGPNEYSDNPSLPQFFDILSTNIDFQNKEFISTIEGKKYPIYGLQWHPEKNPFEWKPLPLVKHTLQSVEASQYMGDFLVSEARKSNHKFSDPKVEYESLIYNYSPVYTADVNPNFVQCYVFDR